MFSFTGHGRDANAKSWETPFRIHQTGKQSAVSQWGQRDEGSKDVAPWEPCTILMEKQKDTASLEKKFGKFY